MSRISMRLKGDKVSFLPGETIHGTGSWELDRIPKRLEARLFWHTSGKAPKEVVLVNSIVFDKPGVSGHKDFEFHLPWGPYSFKGSDINLFWAIELIAFPLKRAARVDITVSPTGSTLNLTD